MQILTVWDETIMNKHVFKNHNDNDDDYNSNIDLYCFYANIKIYNCVVECKSAQCYKVTNESSLAVSLMQTEPKKQANGNTGWLCLFWIRKTVSPGWATIAA